MAERETSSTEKDRVLITSAIKDRLEMVIVCKKLIRATNKAVLKHPEVSELASQVIASNQEIIVTYTNEIREIRNGKLKVY